MLYGIALLQGMVFYGPIATLYRQSQGISVFEITLIESISLVVMIACEIPWGYIADRIGYKKTILICNILYFISKIIFWKADSFIWFLAERLILSIVLSGLSGCDSAYLYLSAGKKDNQKIFGIYNAMSNGGLVIASMIFSLVIKDNYRQAAFFTMLSYGLAMILSFMLSGVHHKSDVRIPLGKPLKTLAVSIGENKKFILFLISSALLMESHQTITVFLSQIQYVRSGILTQYMGYIYIAVTLSGMLSAYSSKLTTWLGESMVIKFLFCIAAVSCILMAVLPHFMISILGIVILRVATSLFIPVSMDIQNRQIKASNRATILSIYSSMMNMIAVCTNLIFGKIADVGIEYAMITGGVFCFVGLILYTLWQGEALNPKYHPRV